MVSISVLRNLLADELRLFITLISSRNDIIQVVLQRVITLETEFPEIPCYARGIHY